MMTLFFASALLAGTAEQPQTRERLPNGRIILCPQDRRCSVPAPVAQCAPPAVVDASGVCVAPAPPCPPSLCEQPPCPPASRRNPTTGSCEPVLVSCPDGIQVPEGTPCPQLVPPPSIIFFDWDSAALSAEARSTLDRALPALKETAPLRINVSGHDDRAGSAQYAVGLSQRRAAAVRDYLVANGIPADRIQMEAFGETRPAVETEDGVREPLNRRVEVKVEPGR